MPTKKSGSRVVLTDPETGESREWLTHDPDEEPPKSGGKGSPTRFSSPYATFFRAGNLLLARDRRIRGTEHRVLAAILLTAPLEDTEFPVRLDRLTAATLMSIGEVAKSLTRLEAVGLISRPRRGWMTLNPEYVWRGSAKTREKALAEKIASGSAAEGDFRSHTIDDEQLQ